MVKDIVLRNKTLHNCNKMTLVHLHMIFTKIVHANLILNQAHLDIHIFNTRHINVTFFNILKVM